MRLVHTHWAPPPLSPLRDSLWKDERVSPGADVVGDVALNAKYEVDGGFPHTASTCAVPNTPNAHSIHFPPFRGFEKNTLFLSWPHPHCSLPPNVTLDLFILSQHLFSTSKRNE